jgi:AraC-like DNA-binding protein
VVYRERASTVAGAVLWQRTANPSASPSASPASPPSAGAGGSPVRILPDGCMDLIWVDGRLVVAGPDTTARLTTDTRAATYTGLRFAPGAAPAVVGVPAHELRGRTVPAAELWPEREVRLIAERLEASDAPGRVLESVAGGRPARDELADPLAAVIAGRVGGTRGHDPASVAATAQAVGLSERQLHRRCLTVFGYGPKTLAGILRMQRAVQLARAGTPFAAVAATAGYADQAHLARDVKRLAGVPLGELIR